MIKIFELSEDVQPIILEGHEGPVYQVSWAHPTFGSILASCGQDGRVIVWKEKDDSKDNWESVYELMMDNESPG